MAAVLGWVAACGSVANNALFDTSPFGTAATDGGASGASDELGGASGAAGGEPPGSTAGQGGRTPLAGGGGGGGKAGAGGRAAGGSGASSSCSQLHQADPDLPSGAYLIAPVTAGAPFMAYCEMVAEGGGWTLVLNAGVAFDQTTNGVADAQCYRQDCTSLAYSRAPLDADVMLDVRDGAIVADNYLARIVITGVASAGRGKTVRTLINKGPSYLEKEDNSNLVVRLRGDASCAETLPTDMAGLVCTSCTAGEACQAPVFVFGDSDPGCADPPFLFAIGGAISYDVPWGNCAGWPQNPSISSNPYYPSNFRIWIR